MRFRRPLFILFFLTSTLLSQEIRDDRKTNPGPSDELTVEECIKIGLENSKAMHMSQQKVEAAQAREKESRSLLYPTLKLNAGYSRLSKVPPFEIEVPLPPPAPSKFTINPSIFNNYNVQLSLQQPVFTGFALESMVKIGRLTAQATEQEYIRDKNELIYNIKKAYWDVYKAGEFKKLIDENLTMVQVHLADIEHFFEQGLAKNNDLLKVRVQVAKIKVFQLEAQNSIRMATMALNSLIGRPVYRDLIITSRIKLEPFEFSSLEELVAKGLSKRPEIKVMQNQVLAADAGIKLARSGRYPQVFLVGNYNYARPNPRMMPVEDKFRDTWDISVAMSIDLWNWKKTGYRIKQAQAQKSSAEEGLGQIKDALTLEISQNYFSLLQDREKITLADAVVAQAEENHRITRERFKAGLALNSDLLDAEVALLEAKIDRTQALVDFELTQAKLKKSIETEYQ